MKSHRIARVSEVIRETAANAILFELKDPRVKNVTVTRAEVSGDLQHAKVFVSVMGTEKEQQLTMHGLKSAAGFVQTKLADRLTSRYVPHVTFVIDEGVKKSIEIARLIREENERLTGGQPAPEEAEDEADESDGDADEGTEPTPESPSAASEHAAEQGPRAEAAEGTTDRPN
ncbi:ribosome-binding factor a : Ribosome-binding factor A OS=Planctomyces limnophilus (strain ATCC 43296 / DSM 3776 / IFAM 1008 / 290) GN=rbfA PE=3 SV=1: RBFA [Gemmata massiliana]|uniref:Ribosome-binding factor A n=1 Tax=Gemmata massiliana TaxID=1210884 RepID=A0A6P2DMC3_9BACT|nr:30S ribosome-binding factor RbfA [Gemmata massiliana]VTS03713.1 ribosome-binding factor a : Ribosome-binding factor A OS=Planctomyces limnophilus (strain ATCC 43296 / DSM 3776 / IFAM 1008 / 290) GN=rbfA PE=3 SV=1: RBFA [Gemmata massiliana]